MSKPNRNDPCPCGSGKKYKKCCLAADDNLDFRYRRWQHVEQGLIAKLTEFGFDLLGDDFVDEAWKVFVDDPEAEAFDPNDPLIVILMPWCFIEWRFEFQWDGRTESVEATVADLFLEEQEHGLSADELVLLVAYRHSPFSFCEVIELRPGFGITLFDLLRRVKYDVLERHASQTLKRGEIIYCATVEFGDITYNRAMGPYALPPIEKGEILRLRKWILEQANSDEISAIELNQFADAIRIFYLDSIAAMFSEPKLGTTDGDPWVPHKVYFDLVSPDEAFRQLKDLAFDANTKSGSPSVRGAKRRKAGTSTASNFDSLPTEADLLRDAVIEDRKVMKIEIPWLGGTEEARERLGGPVLLGLLKIDGNQLIAEVNSVARAETVKLLIEGRCGGNATYKSTLIEPIDAEIAEMWAAAAGEAETFRIPSVPRRPGKTQRPRASEDSSAIENDAELQKALREMAKSHWDAWLNEPVPALNDATPREAAKTEEGRDLLKSLLLHFEHQTRPNDPLGPDLAKLRRKLRM